MIVDACSSFLVEERNTGLQMIRDLGVTLTTFQSLAFEMIKTKEHPNFKQILNLVKDHPSDSLTNLTYEKPQAAEESK